MIVIILNVLDLLTLALTCVLPQLARALKNCRACFYEKGASNSEFYFAVDADVHYLFHKIARHSYIT
jgi:hypothetical protein